MKFQKNNNKYKKKIIIICSKCNKHLIKPKRDKFRCPCKKNVINFKYKNTNRFNIL
jgi:hypothetical protein